MADAHVSRHLVHGRDEVVGIARGEQLALVIVVILLVERSADPCAVPPRTWPARTLLVEMAQTWQRLI